jgi:hypothetical protein
VKKKIKQQDTYDAVREGNKKFSEEITDQRRPVMFP